MVVSSFSSTARPKIGGVYRFDNLGLGVEKLISSNIASRVVVAVLPKMCNGCAVSYCLFSRNSCPKSSSYRFGRLTSKLASLDALLMTKRKS